MEVGEVSMKADTTERRAKDIEAALRKIIEENSQLLDKIAEFEAQTKRNTATCEENSHLQKEKKELKARLCAEEKRTVEALKEISKTMCAHHH